MLHLKSVFFFLSKTILLQKVFFLVELYAKLLILFDFYLRSLFFLYVMLIFDIYLYSAADFNFLPDRSCVLGCTFKFFPAPTRPYTAVSGLFRPPRQFGLIIIIIHP